MSADGGVRGMRGLPAMPTQTIATGEEDAMLNRDFRLRDRARRVLVELL